MRNTDQVNRQLAIEEMNAQSRALEIQNKIEQEEGRGGFYRPTGIDKYGSLAEETGLLDASFGTGAGGSAYYQGVDFGSADAVTPFNVQGGTQGLDVPKGPISPELLAYEENLQQGLEGYTDVYYDNVKKLNEMSAFAASNGMNIKQPDPLDKNQRNISNYYNQLLKETMQLASQLKQGYDAEKMRAEKGYRALTHAGSAIGVPTQFEDLAQDKLPSVERFNASIKTGGYTDYSAYKSELARYNAMRDNLEAQRDAYEANGQLDQADRYNEFIEALQKPTYDGSVNKRLQLERDKMKSEEAKWQFKQKLGNAKRRSTEDIIYAVGNAFNNKASFRADLETGELVNGSFNGLKYGGGNILGVIMKNPSNLSDTELDRFRSLLSKQKDIIAYKEKYKQGLNNNPDYTESEKQALSQKYLSEFGLTQAGLSSDEMKELKDLKKRGADSMGELYVRYKKSNSKGEGDVQEVKAGTGRDFLRALAENNPKTIDDETIAYVGDDNGWLNESGDWTWDKVIGEDYKERNKFFNAAIRAKEGNYQNIYESLDRFLMGNSDFDRSRTGYFQDMAAGVFTLFMGDYNYADENLKPGANIHDVDTRGTKLESLGTLSVYPSDETGKYDLLFGGGTTYDTGVASKDALVNAVGRDLVKKYDLDDSRGFTRKTLMQFLKDIKFAENSTSVNNALAKINDINDVWTRDSAKVKAKAAQVVEDNTTVQQQVSGSAKIPVGGFGMNKK